MKLKEQLLKSFKNSIDADVISLTEIGWSASRDDEQIKKYVKNFIENNYGKRIDDDLALIIVWIIDDLLTDMRSSINENKLQVG